MALCKEVSDFAEYYQIQPSNMYNIFDFAAVLDMFLTVKSRTCGLSDGFFSAVMDHQPITITVCQNHVRVESHAAKDAVHLSKMDAQKLLLTPYGRYMELSVPLDWFPLPLFWLLQLTAFRKYVYLKKLLHPCKISTDAAAFLPIFLYIFFQFINNILFFNLAHGVKHCDEHDSKHP